MNLPDRQAVPFKICPKCEHEWFTREQWLHDPSITLVGYQANFKVLKTGIFLFNHSCGTTLALYAHEFEDLYDGPIFVQRAHGTDECPGHCVHEGDLEPCPAQCECNYVRHVLQLIQTWPKSKIAEKATMPAGNSKTYELHKTKSN